MSDRDDTPAITWQDAVISSRPSGIDRAQLERFRALTPTERLEEMRRLLAEIAGAREAKRGEPDGARLPTSG